MSQEIYGQKVGSTRIFDDAGVSHHVTVVQCEPCHVIQKKTDEVDGYTAVKIAYGKAKKNLNAPEKGQYIAAGVKPGAGMREIRRPGVEDLSVGDKISVNVFEEGQLVDVTGTSKGKGFQGCVKRWGFKMQDATHGNSVSHRAPGSIGQCQDPGRVFKGKKMAGQMGSVQKTSQNLRIMRVDEADNLLLIKGAIPGAPGGLVRVMSAMKRKRKSGETS